MARIVKEYDVRRTEILENATLLFAEKGYVKTTVRDIIERAGIAKGTFYHYFESKQALVVALTKQAEEQTLLTLTALVENQTLTAAEKLTQFYHASTDWKIENKEAILSAFAGYYREENVMMRENYQAAVRETAVPLIAKIINQGITEGQFHVEFALEAADIIFDISLNFSGAIARILLQNEQQNDLLSIAQRKAAASEQAIERILGAPEHSLPIIHQQMLASWFT